MAELGGQFLVPNINPQKDERRRAGYLRALSFLNHKEGDFPISDKHTKSIITFPCDQHLSRKEIDYVISTVKEFYKKEA